MAYNPINPNGQTTAASSAPVVLPLDTAPATQNITTQDLVSATGTGANSQSIITGAATANSTASFAIATLESLRVQVTGTWTGTLQPEISYDGGTTWYILGLHQIGSAYTVASFTANFGSGANVTGGTNFRLRATAAMTGTATVRIIGSTNPSSVYVANGLNIQDATTQTQKLSVSATGAAKVDGSAVTQPVSIATAPVLVAGSAIIGKVTTDQTTHGTTDLVAADITKLAGTATDVNSGVKSAGTLRVVLATDQPALTNKLLVTPDSVALPANQSVNVSQINAVTPLMGNGVTGTGSQRVTIASDNTPHPIKIDQTTVGTTNAMSVAQIGANTVLTGNGVTGTGSLRVTLASDTSSNTNPLLVAQKATTTTTGLLINKVLSAANTTPIQIKTTAGAVYGWHLFNTSAATRYVRFFNVSSSPTMGTTSPTFVIPLPAGGGAVFPVGPIATPMGTGIFYAITTGATDLDNTAGAANDVVGTIFSI